MAAACDVVDVQQWSAEEVQRWFETRRDGEWQAHASAFSGLKGIDFAAPQGTPIYAAGNGTVHVAGRNGAYGNYVRIRHNESYSTAYGHLRGIAKGVRKGSRVVQGQVIGYVGTTGRSTGPHLHFEILVAERQVNPLKVKMPSGRKLEGAELERFHAEREVIERAYATLRAPTRLAVSGR